MGRRRFFQFALLTAAVVFLLVLLIKFRPRLSTPAPVAPPPGTERGEGTLSATAFKFVQQHGSRVDYTVVAEEVSITPGGEKLLKAPQVAVPLEGGGEDRARGDRALLNPTTKAFRIYDNARLEAGGWTCQSTGFRFTPEGEAVSEAPVTFEGMGWEGSAELLRYQRATREVHLEGAVSVRGEAGRSLDCTKLFLDLNSHRGAIEGPVRMLGPEGRCSAPRGTLVLTEKNRMDSLQMGSPFSGEGPQGTLRASSLTIMAGADGSVREYRLEGGVALRTSGQNGMDLDTALLTLSPGTSGNWSWVSPGHMVIESRGERATASRGTGSFGAGTQPVALLEGPVRGTGPEGDFSGDLASLKGGTWALSGEGSLCRAGDTLRADRVTWIHAGEGSAEGNVQGARADPKGGPPLEFRGNSARVGAGGYPVKIAGDAVVTRADLVLWAPLVEILSPSRILASGGATGVLRGQDGSESRIEAAALGYDGAKALAWGEGSAVGSGRGYRIWADRVEADLDPKKNPARYRALGKARFDGTDYEGEGDRMSYEIASRTGEAVGEERDAVVVQKNPRRRVAGPRVFYGPSRFEAGPAGEGGAARRGKMDGEAPGTGRRGKAAVSPPAAPGGEKRKG